LHTTDAGETATLYTLISGNINVLSASLIIVISYAFQKMHRTEQKVQLSVSIARVLNKGGQTVPTEIREHVPVNAIVVGY